MQLKPLKPATLAFTILLLTACQTTSDPSASEIREAVEPVEQVAARVKAEVCRGQTPEKIDAETYNLWPSSAQQWFTNRLAQYKAGCVD
jgi:outer membrane lipoprotein-sorting protein